MAHPTAQQADAVRALIRFAVMPPDVVKLKLDIVRTREPYGIVRFTYPDGEQVLLDQDGQAVEWEGVKV